jgi:hypothetical protein
VVYGTQLKDIIGKVKMVAVGYGREAEDGSQTFHILHNPTVYNNCIHTFFAYTST